MKNKLNAGVLIVLVLEIFLLVTFIPASSYSLGAVFGNEKHEDFLFGVYEGLRDLVFDEGALVSAKSNALTGTVKNNPTQFFNPGSDLFSSALDELSGGGVSTCTLSRDGKVCQEYTNAECEDACAGECLAGERDELPAGSACEVGLCFDDSEGTCQPRSTRGACEDLGGELIGEGENDARCEIGCCILGDQSLFVTERRCQIVSRGLGLVFGDAEGGNYFDGTIQNELICLAQTEANSEKKGACVIDSEEGNRCSFVSGGECSSINGNMDNFHPDKLCSNSELETICLKQNSTACVEGKDEVYWFDSCGNRENIFEGDSESARSESWNGGLIKSKEESCDIKRGTNNVGNQDDCGNCNRFLGSICGEEIDGQELDDNPDGGVVCLDLGCTLEDGSRRENGESWCEYQSKVGTTDSGNALLELLGGFWGGGLGGILGGDRGRDTPGSEHFRASCLDGEVHIEPCQDHRNNVCVQGSIEKEGGGEFTSASCRMNRWQECLNYNPTQEDDEGEFLSKIKTELAMSECSQDPDCFVKEVKIDDGFEFPVCVPKYPPGFDTLLNYGGAEQVCGFASQTCTAVFVKEAKAFGAGGLEWECVANCDCVEGDTPEDAQPSQKFIDEMNNYCVSLGDCGSSVNYMGHAPGGKGYDARTDAQGDGIFGIFSTLVDLESLFGLDLVDVMVRSGDADADPDFAIIEDSNATLESVGDSLDSSLGSVFDVIGDLIGIDLDLEDDEGGSPPVGNNPQPDIDDGSAVLTPIGYVSGAMGIGMMGLAHAGLLPTSVATFGVASESGAIVASGISKGSALAQIGDGPGSLIGPQYTGLGGAFMGGAMGAAAVTMLIQMTGIGQGIGSAQAGALTGVGATGGSMIAYSQYANAQIASEFTASLAAEGFQTTNALTSQFISQFPIADKLAAVSHVGIVILAVVVITIVVLEILGAGEIQEVNVQFECKPWEAPLGGANCELCGSEEADGLNDDLPCSRYACQSLGQACSFIEQDPVSVCVDLNPNDVSSPEVVELDQSVLVGDYDYERVTEGGFSFRRDGKNECMSQYESAIFGVKTDELARCRLGKAGADSFDLMSDFGSGNYLKKNHTFIVPAQELLQLVPGYEDELVEVNLFMKCIDARGNIEDVSDYVINFCVDPIDLVAPVVIVEGGYSQAVAHETEFRDLGLLLFEDAECRASEEDIEYDLMSEDLSCLSEREYDGASPRCVIEDIPLELGDNELFIRCKDHPEWAGTNKSEERNVNLASWPVNIFRTEEALNVSIIEPLEKIIAGTQIVSTTVFAETVAGIQDGVATCEYNLNGGEFAIMEVTGERMHSQVFDVFTSGEHEIVVRCVDTVGNAGQDEITFEIEKDLDAPRVTRVYDDFGTLVVISDEPATCAFVNEKPDRLTDVCGFNVADGEQMSGDLLEHRTNFDKTKTYYVRCEDGFKNKLPGCGIVVKGAEF